MKKEFEGIWRVVGGKVCRSYGKIPFWQAARIDFEWAVVSLVYAVCVTAYRYAANASSKQDTAIWWPVFL